MDHKKLNRTRRSRGYSWEKKLVDTFNAKDGWAARRLGGSSSYLPDVIATNKQKSILYSIECKSGEANILYIPWDQIIRCRDITENFLTAYEKRFVVFAFKFKGTDKRKLQYRFVICTHVLLPSGFDKAVAYNISKDSFIYPSGSEIEVIDNKITSISEFVNFL